MPLRLFNTLTKSKDDFAPLDAKNVRMYVCGPTVYDFAHIGNARPAIVFDVLFRLLKHEYERDGGKVTYARNFTDVDDKINARAAGVAATKGIPVEQARAELTATTERQYLEDVRALGCLDPNEMPRATEHIGGMIAIIEKLVADGFAYAAEGHVLFDVSKKADYGKLANRSLKEMVAGARVEVAPYKKGAMDFVLWKPSDDATPGWESPWGRGRPGWHIECSAMIAAKLGPGDTIDIHGGGIDLVFPHHENEIAQSESAHHGHALAQVWMHNGFLQVEGEKMSKSAGNFFTIRDLLETENFGSRRWSGQILRLAMLMTHYRQPIDWTVGRLKLAEIALRKMLFTVMQGLNLPPGTIFPEQHDLPAPSDALLDALADDLNTPRAITFHFSELMNRANPAGTFVPQLAKQVWADSLFLGLDLAKFFDDEPLTFAKHSVTHDEEAILLAIEARKAARASKDFAESDRIRDDLLTKGIVLKDGPQGTTWEVKR